MQVDVANTDVDNDIFAKFFSLNKIDKLKYIVDVKFINPCIESALINYYNTIHKCDYLEDLILYNYSYLKTLTMYHAVVIYDSLQQEYIDDMLYAIKKEHPHLHQLVDIHNKILAVKAEVYSVLSS